LISHNSPDCKSRVTYRGVLKGEGTHGTWIANSTINPVAKGTDTFVEDHNLILGLGPLADSEPNLEILTGDIVSAGHAATTGRFDDEQMFYLESRGILAADAERMIAKGFFEAILGQLGDPKLGRQLLETVDQALAA
jgi:Fe-S cluster assembly protein SufD